MFGTPSNETKAYLILNVAYFYLDITGGALNVSLYLRKKIISDLFWKFFESRSK